MAASAQRRALRHVGRRTSPILSSSGLWTAVGRLGAALLGLAFVVIAWNGVKVMGVSVFYVVLAPAAGALVLWALATGRRFAVPLWLWVAASAIAVAAALAGLFPPSDAYMDARYVHVGALVRLAGRSESQSNLGNLVKFLLCLIAIPLLVGLAGQSRLALQRLGDLWALSGLASAAVAVSDQLGVTHINRHALGIPTWGREAGLTINPNHVAVMSAMAIPFVALWILRSPRWRGAGVVRIALLFRGIYASRSRGGLLAGPVALVAVAAAVPRLRRLAFALLAALAVAAAVWMPHIVRHARLGGASAAESNSERHHLLLQARADIEHSPLYGLGFRVVNDAHDIYLQLLAAGGAVALGAFLVFALGTIAAGRAAAGADRPLAVACSAAVGTWWMVGFIENQLVDPYLYVPVALLVSLAAQAAWAPVRARARGPLRIVVHDYSGHPFQAQLSRELARRGHEVLHLHCPGYHSGKGALERTAADPPGFEVEPVRLA